MGSSIDASQYDAVACVSGDGLPHEFLNGVMGRKDAEQVLNELCIAPIPAGTSNALVCNLSGPQHAGNVAEACLSGSSSVSSCELRLTSNNAQLSSKVSVYIDIGSCDQIFNMTKS